MKLKKLILAGFKSFADRTEFEFDEGVSCVVGPNGCGKSNIVDAVKWVLGEQSAKSLRGSEMTDVIFNGSSNRRASGMAEVTLIFDNSSGILQPAGSGEVSRDGAISVTRRLYRSGQSEYLINKAPCRLKDIREMFMDTGIGRDAYSLIEQGRVESFLQAGREDRRAIFDEAAGISKYKARKAETLRKLERVEQNLLRLGDIVGEVEKRLRSIKYQASKARSHQTYTDRLKELQSLHLLARHHKFSVRRGELQARLDEGVDLQSAAAAGIDQLESARSAAEVEAVDLERSARDLQGQIASLGGRILTCRQRAEMLTARVRELGEQIVSAASRCEELEAKIGECDDDLIGRSGDLERIDAQGGDLSRRSQAAREEHKNAELALAHLQARIEDEKAGTIDLLRRTTQLHNEINAHGIRRENFHSQRARLTGRAEEITHTLEDLLTQRARIEAKLTDVREVLGDSQSRLDETRESTVRLVEDEKELHEQLSGARERRSGLRSRIEALREMQERLEGVGAGVRKVLKARREGRLDAIRGMLSDFVRTDVEHAPLIEAALAGAEEQLVVPHLADLMAARDELAAILGDAGVVEVICLDQLDAFSGDFDPARCPQVLARAIDWVRFEPFLAPAMWRLLGRTLVTKTLDDAVAAARLAPAGMRFVTLRGEVLEADGRVRIGSVDRGAGVITRSSELAELASRTKTLDDLIEQLQQRSSRAHDDLEHRRNVARDLRTAIYEANTQRVDCESRRSQLDEQIASLRREQPVVAADIDELADRIEATVAAEHEAKVKSDELERNSAERQEQIERLTGRIDAGRQRRNELADTMTDLKVALAAMEEKKLSLREAMNSLTRQKERMEQDLSAGRSEIDMNRRRCEESQAQIEKANAEVDELYARQTHVEREANEVEQSRTVLQERLGEVRSQLTHQRRAHDEAAEKVNALRVELSEADVRIENLITRADDEMHMNLLEQYADYEHDQGRDWDAVAGEIDELREKVRRLGNVNLDAIGEQEELSQRQEFLTAQLDDIRTSHNQLNDLIRRINRQSRELFLQTFETVRENFRTLFRKLFGGGRADIILTDPEDVLESGIEIFARPPGKELRTLSLLSGGEKTMTALALMFSIFRSRPSPFCLLDEVDAALDETNTERFCRLVGEFVADSQFLIISHAKRTMSVANVLYGVTMQEPGVSKRISVRFEAAAGTPEEQLQPVGV